MAASYKAKLTSKGQLTLPVQMRTSLKLQPGDNVRFVEDGSGRFWVENVTLTLKDLKGAVKSADRQFTSEEIAAMIVRSRAERGNRS